MAQETNQTQAPLLCSTGCGFYGNPRNNGMCSVCYKDFLQRQNSSGHVSPAGSSAESSVGESLLAQRSDGASVVSPAASSPAHTQPAHCSGTPTASATPEEGSSSGAAVTLTAEQLPTSEPEVVVESSAQTEEKPKPKKNRCFTCNKRVGLTGFDCRCVGTSSAACTDTPTSTTAPSTTKPTRRRRSGKKTPSSSAEKIKKI
uniref:Zinc finger, AN1-type domain 6 n=1 Tax=Salarias fasciatus TaxID=181472 RepID=A0A672G7M3_SALFA